MGPAQKSAELPHLPLPPTRPRGNNNTGGTPSHSGTFNGASAATEFGIPAIAVSLQTRYDWPAGARAAAPSAAQYTVHLVQRIQNAAGNGPLMPQGTTVNVNLPLLPGTADPATGEPTSALPPKGTDVRAVNDGYVSLTPLELDRDVDESTAAWLRSVLRRGETN